MIQRIQSIYLLVAAIALAVLFALPFATCTPTADGPLAAGDLDIQDNVGLLGLVIAIAALNIVTIFLFNNRKLQMTLTKTSIILILVLLAGVAYFIFTAAATLGVGLGIFTPVIGIVVLFLANRAIDKDEKLVKSSDRIR